MKCISLMFAEDLQRDDLEQFKLVRGCLGVSAYQNTINLYFRQLEYVAFSSLAKTLQRHMVLSGTTTELTTATLNSEASTNMIISVLREEATV